jgi:hypothetical protein
MVGYSSSRLSKLELSYHLRASLIFIGKAFVTNLSHQYISVQKGSVVLIQCPFADSHRCLVNFKAYY